ncbi:PTS sugar transporter subunit IIA [Thermoanaerobacter wiegelii]|uniref:PTS system fructose subfamily IIA component n=1 Tax=Thermoanaerobacter wiegelii Rt8.B1 TaxID=697303 RepID=G2MTT7_9THEO|nr:PTS sugar transporter subunit IIA [Thermoanaerobacter wiegelii]AEM79472.1 PTS system fructose subfamily IIA component [Thermoanaerobacter wiegelii Rt8.B1]
MVGILLLTHGVLADAMIDVVNMVLGKQELTASVGLKSGDNIDDFRKKAYKYAKELDEGDGVLILTDIPGGSPANIAAEIVCYRKNVAMVTGINLPMLLETFVQRKVENLNNLANQIVTWGIDGIKVYKSEDIGGVVL